MSKLEILVLREDLEKTVSVLHNLGLLHIESNPLTSLMEQRGVLRISLTPEQEKEKSQLETLIKQANALIQPIAHLSCACLPGATKIEENFESKSFEELTAIIRDKLKPRLASIIEEKIILKDELEIPLQIERLTKTLFEFAKENLPVICAIKAVILNRLEEITVKSNFLQSKYTAAITGWIPRKDLSQLTRVLEKSLGSNFVVYERTSFVKQTQQIPVLLDNPKITRPYELLLSLLPPPKYGTIDATGLVSLSFPLFFGLIVGDIGYGLIFLFISLFLRKSAKLIIRSASAILFAASLSSIFFGILFGEFFGNLGKIYLHLPHLLFDRHEAIIPFLALALSVGLFHIVLGFLLGIIEAFRKRHQKEAVEKISILAGLAGLFMLIATLVKILPSGFLPPSIALLTVVVVLLIFVKGFLGPLEAISAVANILSYARIMALGLAGVMMAHIANHIGGLPENIFIGIILASLIHALNLVLSIFSPTIQSLRLHYVEFFSKFYEPGGKKYNPFKKKEVAECVLSH